MSITPPPGMTECDSCDGFGNAGFDEQGMPYTCYRCCTTGWIPAATVEQERREAEAYAAAHPRPEPYRYTPANRVVGDGDDDIPF